MVFFRELGARARGRDVGSPDDVETEGRLKCVKDIGNDLSFLQTRGAKNRLA